MKNVEILKVPRVGVVPEGKDLGGGGGFRDTPQEDTQTQPTAARSWKKLTTFERIEIKIQPDSCQSH